MAKSSQTIFFLILTHMYYICLQTLLRTVISNLIYPYIITHSS